jgi:hypothetical protein
MKSILVLFAAAALAACAIERAQMALDANPQ